MLKPFAAALVVSVSASFNTEAYAAEFNFSAFINSISNETLDPLPQLGLAPGDTITGSFSYDLNTPANYRSESETGSFTAYQQPGGRISPSIGQISFDFGPTSTTLQFATIQVFDNRINQDTNTFEDEFHVVADSSMIFPAPITGDDRGYSSAISQIDLRTNETFFDSSALPTTLNLDDFIIARTLTFSGRDQATGVREGFSATFTSITDITTVDTPFSGLLLASGCMMLWMRRRPGTGQSQSV